MKFYFAPMEGITGYLYRNAYHTCFSQVEPDKYFTPFFVPMEQGKFTPRDMNDMAPEHNRGMNVVPQLLTNRADDFIGAARTLKDLGYEEVNLNLGCPSGTVVAKRKGSGFLAYPEELDRFLDRIFEASEIKISVKTRIGKDDPDEFDELLEIYNRYPIEELIVHPRMQRDFYKNRPNMEAFEKALDRGENPVCYNGNIFTARDYREFVQNYHQVEAVMLGRGLIANPWLIGDIRGEQRPGKEQLLEFHDLVCDSYREYMSGDRNVLFKMKELWLYLGCMFPDADRLLKKIKKSERLSDYDVAVRTLFRERDLLEGGGYRG